MEQQFLSEKNTTMLFDLFKNMVHKKLNIQLGSEYYAKLTNVMEDLQDIEFDTLQEMNKHALSQTTRLLVRNLVTKKPQSDTQPTPEIPLNIAIDRALNGNDTTQIPPPRNYAPLNTTKTQATSADHDGHPRAEENMATRFQQMQMQ